MTAPYDDDLDRSRDELFADLIKRGAHADQLKLQLEHAQRETVGAATEHERVLRTERGANEQLWVAARSKDEFLANLSHELRTPLGAILGWSQLVRPGLSSPAELSEAMLVIERNTRHLIQLIEDLLDMSRVVSGQMKIEVQRLDLAQIVRGAVESFRPAAAAKEVTLETRLDSTTAPVTGDGARLLQVV